MVGNEGELGRGSFCWRGEIFRAYIREELKAYLKHFQPDAIWVDDDFRPRNHAPVKFGCFCDSCIAEFNKRYSHSFDRHELVSEYLHGDKRVRREYTEFLHDGLSGLMETIASTVHDYSPKTAVALQCGTGGSYVNDNYAFIHEKIKSITGMPSMVRCGAGGYSDYDPGSFISSAWEVAYQNSKLPDFVEVRAPESENTPFTAYNKSPAGTVLGISCYMVYGNTDVSLSSMMNLNEPMSWHEEELRLIAEQRAYWERLSSVNRRSVGGGLRFAVSGELNMKSIGEKCGMQDFWYEHFDAGYPLIRHAVPMTFDKSEREVLLLNGVCARDMSDAELQAILSGKVIMDVQAASVMKERGFDLGVLAEPLSRDESIVVSEYFPEHPLNRDIGVRSYKARDKCERMKLVSYPEDTEVLGLYGVGTTSLEIDKDKLGAATVIVKTPSGGHVAVFAGGLWIKGAPHFWRERLLNIAEYIGGAPLSARCLSRAEGALSVRVDKRSGKTLAASFISTSVGEYRDVQMLVRNPECEEFTVLGQYDAEENPKVERTPDGFLVTIPKVHPWSCVTVFCDKQA